MSRPYSYAFETPLWDMSRKSLAQEKIDYVF